MSDLVSHNVNMIFSSPKGEAVHALKDITFTLKQGELLTVLGPSGCGKTTLLNIAAGFLRPTSGSITLGNKEISGPGVERISEEVKKNFPSKNIENFLKDS